MFLGTWTSTLSRDGFCIYAHFKGWFYMHNCEIVARWRCKSCFFFLLPFLFVNALSLWGARDMFAAWLEKCLNTHDLRLFSMPLMAGDGFEIVLPASFVWLPLDDMQRSFPIPLTMKWSPNCVLVWISVEGFWGPVLMRLWQLRYILLFSCSVSWQIAANPCCRNAGFLITISSTFFSLVTVHLVFVSFVHNHAGSRYATSLFTIPTCHVRVCMSDTSAPFLFVCVNQSGIFSVRAPCRAQQKMCNRIL